jgi:hypothetical protein
MPRTDGTRACRATGEAFGCRHDPVCARPQGELLALLASRAQAERQARQVISAAAAAAEREAELRGDGGNGGGEAALLAALASGRLSGGGEAAALRLLLLHRAQAQVCGCLGGERLAVRPARCSVPCALVRFWHVRSDKGLNGASRQGCTQCMNKCMNLDE